MNPSPGLRRDVIEAEVRVNYAGPLAWHARDGACTPRHTSVSVDATFLTEWAAQEFEAQVRELLAEKS